MQDSPITPEIVAEHGLSPEEYERVLGAMGRAPNLTELGIFSVMWSEHCSYKSSRIHLKTLPTQAPWVICGPGENAGVIDIGDGDAAIFKMESHNHPSYIEPYQGAATGVGGILRDVFTMGARPIANLNALLFAARSSQDRHLSPAVAASALGNCVRRHPTVFGDVNFHAAYDGTSLSTRTVGSRADRISYSERPLGNPSSCPLRPGRDGIHRDLPRRFRQDAREAPDRLSDPSPRSCLSKPASSCGVDANVPPGWARGPPSSSVEMRRRGVASTDITPCPSSRRDDPY